MKLTVLGCAGSFAGPHSPASSYLVQAVHDGRTHSVVFDLGNGSFGTLQRHLDPMALDAVFLSHLHPDHCIDLTGMYVYRKYHPDGAAGQRLAVHGPAGVRGRMRKAYEGLEDDGMDAQFDFRRLSDGATVEVGPLRITARSVEHPVEAFGFRIEADGAILTYSGDTDSCDGLLDLARGSDLMLVDAAFVEGRDHTRGIHLTGRRAAEAAIAAGARRLMLTHLPAWNDPAVCRAEAEEVWPGEVEIARLGATYDLGS